MDKNEAQRRLQQGKRSASYRKTSEYKDALKYANAHYRGVNRGLSNYPPGRGMGGVGPTKKPGCPLWSCIVLVAVIAIPTVIDLLT